MNALRCPTKRCHCSVPCAGGCWSSCSFGVGVVTLANTGYVTTGYRDGLVYAIAGVAGGAVALAAGLTWMNSFSPKDSHDRGE